MMGCDNACKYQHGSHRDNTDMALAHHGPSAIVQAKIYLHARGQNTEKLSRILFAINENTER